MKLKDKVAVITGSGSGIGRAIALRFAEEGARVVIASRTLENAEATLRKVQLLGTEAFLHVTDVRQKSSVESLFRALDERQCGIDILVNNAGQAGPMTPLHETSDEQWHSYIEAHLHGTFYCTREATKRMLEQKRGGAIINMASVAALRGLSGASAYSAAKGAMVAFTKAVAQEYAIHNIRINALAPGWVETPMLDHWPKKLRTMMPSMTPLGRIGKPEEIAEVALFLASDASSLMVGQVLSPNGGTYM